jgi:hypothetical protein
MRNTFGHSCDITAKSFADLAEFRKEHVLYTALYLAEIIFIQPAFPVIVPAPPWPRGRRSWRSNCALRSWRHVSLSAVGRTSILTAAPGATSFAPPVFTSGDWISTALAALGSVPGNGATRRGHATARAGRGCQPPDRAGRPFHHLTPRCSARLHHRAFLGHDGHGSLRWSLPRARRSSRSVRAGNGGRAPKSRGPVSSALGRTACRIPRKINRLKGTVADLPRL